MRIVVPALAVTAALAVAPLSTCVAELDVTALAILGALVAIGVLAWAGIGRLDLLLLGANLAAIAFLPAIEHRGPLDPGRPSSFYDWTLLRITAPELLAAAAIAAEWLRRQASGAVAPRVGVSPLLAIGLLALGLLVGLARGTELEACVRDGRKIAYVALAHWLVVRVGDDAARRRVLARCLFAALAARAVVTIVSFLTDRGFHYAGFLRASVDVGDFLGFLALICLPAAELRTRRATGRERLLLWLFIALGSAATLATFSRAAWCAAPVAIGVLLLHRVSSARPMPRLLVAVALLAAMATPLLLGGVAERAFARVAPLFAPSGDSSVSYRVRELRGATAVVADHPILGLGLGTTFDAGAALIDRRRLAPTMVHNVFLWSTVKAGFFGLAALLALLGIAATQLSRTARHSSNPRIAGAALGLLALLAAFLLLGLVGAMLNQARVAIALGLLTGAAQSLAARPSLPLPGARRDRSPAPRPRGSTATSRAAATSPIAEPLP